MVHRRSTPQTLASTNYAAQRLAVSVRMVWRLIADGHLPVIHIGRSARIRVSDIDRLARFGTRGAAARRPGN